MSSWATNPTCQAPLGLNLSPKHPTHTLVPQASSWTSASSTCRVSLSPSSSVSGTEPSSSSASCPGLWAVSSGVFCASSMSSESRAALSATDVLEGAVVTYPVLVEPLPLWWEPGLGTIWAGTCCGAICTGIWTG